MLWEPGQREQHTHTHTNTSTHTHNKQKSPVASITGKHTAGMELNSYSHGLLLQTQVFFIDEAEYCGLYEGFMRLSAHFIEYIFPGF